MAAFRAGPAPQPLPLGSALGIRPSRESLARRASPAAPLTAQPTLQESAPFHGADSWPGERRLRLRSPPNQPSRSPRRSTAQTPGPESVACGSAHRPTNPPGVRAVPRRRLLARRASPAAPLTAQPTLQESAPFHGADSWPGERRLRLRSPPNQPSRSPRRSTAQTPGPESVACGSAHRPTNPPGVRAVPRRRLLARRASPAAPLTAQPTLQESAPFHGADSWPGERRLRLRSPPNQPSRSPRRSTAQTPGPESVACGSAHRPTNPPGVRAVPRRRLLARRASPAAPLTAQPTLQESAPFHGADS